MRFRSATVRRCSPGRTGSSRCSTRYRASASRSSRCRSRRYRPCCWPRAIRTVCGHWCCRAHMRRISDVPSIRAECRKRRLRGISHVTRRPSGRVRWSNGWRRVGWTTSRSGGGGRAVSDSPAAQGISRRCSTCFYAPMCGRRWKAFRRRPCCCIGAVTAMSMPATRSISPRGSRKRGW